MIIDPEDHPLDRPGYQGRQAGKWARVVAAVTDSPELVIATGTAPRVLWLRQQLPGHVVVLDEALGRGITAAYPPDEVPGHLVDEVAAQRRRRRTSRQPARPEGTAPDDRNPPA